MQSIYFKKSSNNDLQLCCRDLDIFERLIFDTEFFFHKCFLLKADDLLNNENSFEDATFIFGKLIDGYWVISKEKLRLTRDIKISSNCKPKSTWFCAVRNISIFRKLDKMIDSSQQIIIGGDDPEAIPEDIFLNLLGEFPKSSELDKYAHMRIASVLQDYVEMKRDFIHDYESYRAKKSKKTPPPAPILIQAEKREYYQNLHDTLSNLLENSQDSTEDEWQKNLINLIPLLFPQYVAALPKVSINDVTGTKSKRREIDFLLINSNGCVDVCEIKKPFEKNRVIRKSKYRDNYIPARELTGSVVQAEKYIYYLSQWGHQGEVELSERLKSKGKIDFDLHFSNPKGLILLGDCNFSEEEKYDFELIRKHYGNMIDIVTYNDLLERFERILTQLD